MPIDPVAFSPDILAQLDTIALEVTQPRKLLIIPPGLPDPPKDEDGIEAHLLLLSIHSKQARIHANKVASEAIDRLKTVGLSASLSEDEEAETNDAVDRLLSVLVGWHLVDARGKKINLPFTVENARALLKLPSMGWLLDRGLRYYRTDTNFTKASPKS